jgi:hypothetical protein
VDESLSSELTHDALGAGSLNVSDSNSTNSSQATQGSESGSSEESLPINVIYICMILSVIIIVGVVSNSINVVVFSRKSMREASTFRFLLYLSICDILVLIACSTDALVRFGFDFELRTVSNFTCRLHTFLTYFLTHASSTILMAISIDRALVITNTSISSLFSTRRKKTKHAPSQVRSASTDSSARKFSLYRLLLNYFHRVDLFMMGILFSLGLLNCHYFFFMNLNLIVEPTTESSSTPTIPETTTISYVSVTEASSATKSSSSESFYVCFPLEGTLYNKFLMSTWTWIDICVFSLIPFVVMSICSVIILAKIRSKSKKFFEVLVDKSSERSKSIVYRRMRRNRQLLYMLLITNLYFLLSLLPYCVSFVMFKGQKGETTGQLLVHMLLYTNNAINFLFYGLSSQKYREVFSEIFCNAKKNAFAVNGQKNQRMRVEHEREPSMIVRKSTRRNNEEMNMT